MKKKKIMRNLNEKKKYLRSAAVCMYIRSDFVENGTIFVRAKVSKMHD
jgi:hypothetical protein